MIFIEREAVLVINSDFQNLTNNKMAICKNCGKPLILSGGKCVYCGASPYDIPKTENAKETLDATENEHREPTIESRSWIMSIPVDIVFCIDCSCSMSPVLESIKQNIHILIETFDAVPKESEYYLHVDWRARLVGYRNYDVDEEWMMNNNPFVTTKEELFIQLDGIRVKGVVENENNTSSTLDAIWYAAKSDWRNIRHPVGCWDTYEEEFFKSGGLYGYKYIFIFTDSNPKVISPITIADLSDGNDAIHVESRVIGKKSMHIDKKTTCEDCVRATIRELSNDSISLWSYVPNHPLYTKWFDWPVFSHLIQFEDPISFFYHKELGFSKFVEGLFRVRT